MHTKTLAILVIIVFVLSTDADAQKWKVKNYSIGYRMSEIDGTGSNPILITPLLKEPSNYQQYLSTINYNSLYGNSTILLLHTLYLNAELKNENPLISFWKKYTVQAGLLLTARIRQDVGGIGDESIYYSMDSIHHSNLYSLTKKQQFLGANMGINRRFKISDRLQVLTGFHAQGNFALVHHYNQRWDSSSYKPTTGWNKRTTWMSNLEGKNFFQWQVLVPLGLEYEVQRDKLLVRVELNAGIIGGQYRPKGFALNEAHGAGIWVIYKPQTKK